MASPNADLIAEFGGEGKTTTVVSPNADLINEWAGDVIKAEAPKAQDLSIPSPENFERSKVLETETAAALKKTTTQFSKLPIVRQGIKGFQEGTDLASSGYTDISQNRPAAGVGKIILGHGIQALNAIPVLPTIEAATEQLTKISGNPEFAKRAELVATSGLPVAKTAKVLTNAMPSTRALDEIVKAIGPENIPGVVAQLKSNPRLSLMDVDPNVQIITQGLAAKPGEPRNILDKVVRGRTDTKLDAVTGAIDEAMGTPVNILEKVEGLKKQLKAVGSEINPVIKSTGPVNVTPVITSIDAKLKPGVNSVITVGEPLPLGDIEKTLEKVKGFITDGLKNRTDAQSLHNFQSALRAKADDLLSSTSGQDRQLGRALMDVRNQVVDSIDAAGKIPGEYKAKLAKYRDEYHVTDAFNKGMSVTKNRLGNLEDDPAYWEKWIKSATPAELEAAREGARLAYRHQMASVTNAARKGTDIPAVEFNKEKLELLFGKAEVEKMSKALNDEKKISDTNSKLMQNSMTAMRLLGADATKVRPDYEPRFTKTILPLALEAGAYYSMGSVSGLGAAVGLAYPAIRQQITKVGQKLDRKTNVEITNLASSVGEAKEALIAALQARAPQGKLTMKEKLKLSLPVSKF